MTKEILRKYFFKMGEEERKLVKEWYEENKKEEYYTDNRLFFFKYLEKAIQTIDYDYMIATIEPSMSDDKLYYKPTEKVTRGCSGIAWIKLARSYEPEYNSRLATIYELYLWYAYRIAKKYWSIEFVCDYSCEGNYKGNIRSSGMIELSARREIGGFFDGTGNTLKLVCESPKAGQWNPIIYAVGGWYEQEGDISPVGKCFGNINLLNDRSEKLSSYGVGVIVLTE